MQYNITSYAVDRATTTHLERCYIIKYPNTSIGVRGVPTAAPAGEQCLNDAAAGKPNACFNSDTSCQALQASRRLMYLR